MISIEEFEHDSRRPRNKQSNFRRDSKLRLIFQPSSITANHTDTLHRRRHLLRMTKTLSLHSRKNYPKVTVINESRHRNTRIRNVQENSFNFTYRLPRSNRWVARDRRHARKRVPEDASRRHRNYYDTARKPAEVGKAQKAKACTSSRIFPIVKYLILSLACLYQSGSCLYEYRYGKPAKSVEYFRVQKFPTAEIALCPLQIYGKNPVTNELREEYRRIYGISRDKAKELIFSDFLKLPKMSMAKMWDLYEFTPETVKITVQCSTRKSDHTCVPPYKSTTLNTSSGSCILVYNDAVYKLVSDMLMIRILVDKPKRNPSSWTQIDFYLRVQVAMAPETLRYHEMDSGFPLPILAVSVMPFITEVYNLDLPLYPCKSSIEVERCKRQCLENILFSRVECRLPYMENDTLPNCNTPELFNKTFEITKQVMKMQQNCTESCPRRCYEASITFMGNLVKWGTPRVDITLRFFDTVSITVREYKWYTFSNIIADIGGVFGFFLGLTFLHLCHVVEYLYQHFQKPEAKKQSQVRRDSQVFIEMEARKKRQQTEPLDIAGFDRIFDPNCSKFRKIIWCFAIGFCTLLCSRNIFLEVQEFVHGDPDVKMLTDRKGQVKFPAITLCPYRPYEYWEYIRDLREIYTLEFNVSTMPEDIPISDLMKLEDNMLMDYWNKSGFSEDFIEEIDVGCVSVARYEPDGTTIRKRTVQHNTIYGKCVSIHIETPIRFRGIGVPACIILKSTENSAIREEIQMFLHSSRDDPRTLNPLLALPLTRGTIGFFTITTKVREVLNRDKAPCDDKNEVAKCRSQCLDRLMENHTSCRLPFLNSNLQKLCDNPDDFNKSMETAIAFYNNYPAQWCDCPQKCKEYIYQFTSDGVVFPLTVTILVLHIPTNLFLVTHEYYQTTATTLFANICGNLGFYLGFSVISLFEIFGMVISVLEKKK